MTVNNFDVLKRMAEQEKKIYGFPRDNVTQVHAGKDGWGFVKIAIPNDLATKIMLQDPMIFQLIIADADDFKAIRQLMEQTETHQEKMNESE